MTYIYIQYSICTCNSVMSFYKHKSGAQKRDAAASTERFISKLPKLDNFFSTNISDPQPHTITLQAVDDLSQLLPIDEGHNISARHEAILYKTKILSRV